MDLDFLEDGIESTKEVWRNAIGKTVNMSNWLWKKNKRKKEVFWREKLLKKVDDSGIRNYSRDYLCLFLGMPVSRLIR